MTAPLDPDHPRHRQLMKRALGLARRGWGRTSPNPMVGCVVARDGRVVGEGHHLFAGVRHAEDLALQRAAAEARGADLYVNLEPCCHQGRTPPCTDRIRAAGVGRVFLSVRDPNPLVAGQGAARLRESGIEVVEGLCAERARQLNETFFHYIQHGTPFVLLKLAMTLDGKIATATGDSQWITGEKARRASQRLRYGYDAILVGIETLLADDPSLTVRWRRPGSITRVVLDSHLRTPPSARVFESDDPVIVFHGGKGRRGGMGERVSLVRVQRGNAGLSWTAVLSDLGRRGVSSLIVEGGGRVAASALAAGVVRKICFFYGPRIVGGSGLPGVADLGVSRLDQALRLRDLRVRRLGDDLMLEGYLND